VSVTPLPLPAALITSPPSSLPPPSSSSPSPFSSRSSGEKRGKESSDEDGEEKKAELVAAQAMIEDYNLLKSKRQKLKERKARAKLRRAEDDPALPLLPGDLEHRRVELLCSVKPTPEDVARAERGDPSAHPRLLQLLVIYADFLRGLCGENPPPFLLSLVRRQFLSPSPFTPQAITASVTAETGLSFPSALAE
jgi:hypothetical protein